MTGDDFVVKMKGLGYALEVDQNINQAWLSLFLQVAERIAKLEEDLLKMITVKKGGNL